MVAETLPGDLQPKLGRPDRQTRAGPLGDVVDESAVRPRVGGGFTPVFLLLLEQVRVAPTPSLFSRDACVTASAGVSPARNRCASGGITPESSVSVSIGLPHSAVQSDPVCLCSEMSGGSVCYCRHTGLGGGNVSSSPPPETG
jgi:hypothetical protein